MAGDTVGRRSPPSGALGTGGTGKVGEGVGRGLGAAGGGAWRWYPSGWQQHPACSPAVAAAQAPLVAGWELGAFLKTAFPVKSLLFLICGCRSQSCQGWRWGGSGEVAESWQRFSELAPAPALQAGPPTCPGRGRCVCVVSPVPRADPGGESPCAETGGASSAAPHVHPERSQLGLWGGQGAAGCYPCYPLPPASEALPLSPLQLVLLPTDPL